ncbi:uncharacterized protein [Haliotis asinina]|uniref:uncharacterized protein n=1 Tax=Haliotis asinina TaxID=109174 RepID=UPI003531E58F
MAIYRSLSVVLYISLLTCFNCKPLNGEQCVYTTQDGFIDLSPLASDNETARFTALDSQTNYEYLWSPCNPFNEDAACDNALVCQYIVAIDFYVLMARQDAVLQHNASQGYTALYYVGTDPRDGVTRNTYIELVCSPDVEGQFQFNREEPLGTYHLTLSSKYACMSSVQTTTSTSAAPKTTTSTSAVPKTTTSTSAGPQTTTSTSAAPKTTTSTRAVFTTTSTTTIAPTPPPSPDTPTAAPGPAPTPFNLMTITILLFCILLALCVLNCMICLGLITRSSTVGASASSPGHVNHAFEKKLLN